MKTKIFSTIILIAKLLWFASQAHSQDLYVSHPGGSLDQWIHQEPRITEFGPADYTSTPQTMTPSVVRVFSTAAASAYPTHPADWHMTGSRETKAELIHHLMTHHNHRNVREIYSADDLHAMTREQLLALHDDSHKGRVVNVKGRFAMTRIPEQVSTIRQAAPVQSVPVYYVQAPAYSYSSSYSSACPNGRCPTSTAQRREARDARRQARQDRVGSAGLLGVGAQFGLINVSK